MTPLEKADAYLEDMADIRARIEALEERAEAEMEAVRARYGPQVQDLRGYLARVEKGLVALMKRERDVIFDGRDKVVLSHGALLHGWEERTRIPRDALEKVKELGWTEAVKVVESLDRAVVERWPVERLAAIGAERKAVEVYKYELSGGR
jgi:phage host-nuclease inhibitor protein Gam